MLLPLLLLLPLLPLLVAANARVPQRGAPRLRLVEFSSDSMSYHVGSTLILGPTEAILVDAEMRPRDAARVADSIIALRTHLTAIFITHPDVDHYFGASTLVERFPGTPVYMTAKARAQFEASGPRSLDGFRKTRPADAPDSLVMPKRLVTTSLEIDGEQVQIVPDLQGDVREPTNSFVWIPSLRAVLAGDIVFNHVYPWLTASTVDSRREWHRTIARIRALQPVVVVAAHKKRLDAPDAPDVLDAMDQYLTDFDAGVAASSAPDAVMSAMKAKYPDYAVPLFLQLSANAAFRRP
jgi:glyoxylase-like metal-dependent hydrolase (beta-lactamase superfamily II)